MPPDRGLWPDPDPDDDQAWMEGRVEDIYVRWLFTVQCLVKPLTLFDPKANVELASRVLQVAWFSHSGQNWAGHVRNTAWEYLTENIEFAYEKYCEDKTIKSVVASGRLSATDLAYLWTRATGPDIDHTRGRFSTTHLSQWLQTSEGAVRIRYKRALDRIIDALGSEDSYA